MVLHPVPTSLTMIHEPASTARARCLRERRAKGLYTLNTFRDPEINSMSEISSWHMVSAPDPAAGAAE